MRLAVWNTPPAEFLISGLMAGTAQPAVEVERQAPAVCEQLLLRGRVDVALLPTLSVLRQTENLDVIPGIALSTWAYPYARLVLKHGLARPVRAVACDPRFPQEIVVTQVILKEHYQAAPAFKPLADPSLQALLDADADAALVVGNDVPLLRTEALTLDLGQEWYELANYPMVWGLFATLKGNATAALVRQMRRAATLALERRGLWMQAQEMGPGLHAFYRDDLRVRLDDLAVASLTEFKQYLFYLNVLDEIPEIPYFLVGDDEGEDEEQPLA